MATSRDVDELIEAAFAGERLNAAEIQRIAEHIAAAGFDPTLLVPAGSRLIGIEWQGRQLRRQDQMPTAGAHYLRHVVARQEWPVGTTPETYEASVASIAEQPESGVFINRFLGHRSVGVVGRSGVWYGPEGAEWMLVEYRVAVGHWTTAFQVRRGLGYIEQQRREGFRWL